jgi:cobalt-zinc-cadmium efflux system protein
MRLGITVLLNVFITAIQAIGGFITGSLSLLSDALHNFSDIITLMLSWIAMKLVSRKHTVKKTFGYKRAEIIAAFVNAVSLIAVAIYLITEAIKRLIEPVEIAPQWVIILSAVAIAINGLSAYILFSGSKINLNIRSAYLHLLSDAMTSVAVLIGGLMVYFFEIYWIDSLLTLLISVYLIYISWKLVLESMKVLMLFTPSTIVLESINEKISSIPEIKNIHHVHVWQLDNKKIHFEGHVDFAKDLPLRAVNEVLNNIRDILKQQFNIDHVTLQPEFDSCHDKELISQD